MVDRRSRGGGAAGRRAATRWSRAARGFGAVVAGVLLAGCGAERGDGGGGDRELDARPSAPDARPEIDAAQTQGDGGAPRDDGATAFDMAAGASDGGPDSVDGGDVDSNDAMILVDGSHTPTDGGSVEIDGGSVRADGGPVTMDGGHAEPDGGAEEVDAAPPAPGVLAYCNCMLVTCHDLYHEVWGLDEVEARGVCFAAATALVPEALTCRRRACDQAIDDESACPAAIGRVECN